MPEHSVVLMFSGQGSQYYQMGRAFFEGHSLFRDTLLELDSIASPLLGQSMIDVLYRDGRGKDEPFHEIGLTSPAIFIVEYALAKVLLIEGIKPNYLLASSMGIYAAATTASAVGFRDVIALLPELAKIYRIQCQRGTMIAILGSQTLHRDIPELREISDIAAINFDNHFVIATVEQYVDEIIAALHRRQVAFQKLAVSYPFHSRWIDSARQPVMQTLETLHYLPPKIPVVCCAGEATLEAISPASIWNTVRQPIQFEQTIARLEEHGPHDYVDVGPAGTLATFVKYVLPSNSKSRKYPIFSPFGGELRNYETLKSRHDAFFGSSPDQRSGIFPSHTHEI